MCWKVNLVISVTHVSVSTINCAMYNYQFNRHNVGVNKLVQIHFTMWCFPSCQNDRGRFCSFLRGLAAPFPCGSLIDAFPGSSAGGSGFCPMIESIFSHTSASLASAGCAGSSCCLRRALVRSLRIEADFCEYIVNTGIHFEARSKLYTLCALLHRTKHLKT